MSSMEGKYPYVDEREDNLDIMIKGRRKQEETFIASVQRAAAQAMAEGIKVNSILINKNMVRVPELGFRTDLGAIRFIPRMICGLNVYLTKDELPEGYSFAVLEGPEDRLAQFESIGMEPDELRKAAELYRKVKEVLE